jgi:RNA polymerase sigma-70 factor, ECF subfamily
MSASSGQPDVVPGSTAGKEAVDTLQEQVARLYEESRNDVYRYLLTLGLHPPRAQEATQDVFVRLYTALKGGEVIENYKGWIFRVAHNHGLKLRTRQASEEPFDPSLGERLTATSSNPERELLDRERQSRFHAAVETLSEQQKRCLFLRLEGLHYPEIGAALGISPSAVGEFLRRALTRLRKVGHE